jgi:hypothetical protein
MRICRIASVVLLCAGFLAGQTNRGGITGTVLDPSGAGVPGATVVIKNNGTNQETRTKTSSIGSFAVFNLDPVTYNVSAEAAGFKKEVIENVKVDTAEVANVTLKLETGALSTTVEVQATTAMINTENGTTNSVVEQREIQNLPLENRSVLDLTLTQPNTSGDTGSEYGILVSVTTCPGCALSVNGGRPLSTQFMADGTNNTGVSLARTMVSFSPETVQEFTVQSTAYSAEYGTTGGGIVNATTRSGTNQLNGTALWYNRNPDFAAAPFTLATVNRSPPTQRFNYGSLAVGGPVYIPKLYNGKNHTFWFAAYEPNWRRDFLEQDTLVQSPAERAGDWSNTIVTSSGTLPTSVASQYNLGSTGDANIYDQYSLVNSNQFLANPVPAAGLTYAQFPGNIIPPSMIDSTYTKTLPYYTAAGNYYIGSSGAVENLPNPRLLRAFEGRWTFKIDEVATEKDHFSFRLTSTPIVKTQLTPNTPTSDQADYSYAKQALFTYTRMLSATLLNDLRLNFTRGNFSNTAAPEWDPQTGQNLNTILGLPSLFHGGLPSLPDIGGQGSTENQDHENRYALTDIVFKTVGKMSFKIGGDVSKAQQNVIPIYAAIGGVYSFSAAQTNSAATSGTGGNSFASFELGVPSGLTIRNAVVPYYYRWSQGDAFIQDDWRVAPNLTLNLGIRWSLEMPRTEKYNNQGVFRPDLAQTFPITPMTLADGNTLSSVVVPPFAYSGRGGNSRYLVPPDYKDFEPRFGFAWSPRFLQARKVTIRGGYGLSHAPLGGSNRLPVPDFSNTTNAYSPTSGAVNPNYIMRLGENPPALAAITPTQAVGAPANGLLYNGTANSSLNIGGLGYAVSQNFHTPNIQNWNFTISWQANSSTSVELSYVGLKGTHLFEPGEDIDPRNLNLLNDEEAQNVATGTASIPDPLGRVGTNGKVINIQPGTLESPYVGFSSIYRRYDASADSHREAGYINVVHHGRYGLTSQHNFTYGKSIDDSSSSGGDKNVLTNVGGQVDGLVAFGAARSLDRSVSSFDQRFLFNNSILYDVPFGRGREYLTALWKPLDYVIGGWTWSGTVRMNGGFPASATLSDNNGLGDPSETHTARPNIVSGVPLVNPLFSLKCPSGNGCQPYLNPSAFERPVWGQFGDAPRTFDGARGPWANFYDMSLQKSFRFGESGKRRLQLRVDAINVFNHPIFRTYPNNAGGVDFSGQPSTATLSTSAYNTWAAANGKPAYSSTVGSAGYNLYNQIISNINSFRNSAGVLPNNFYTVQLPANFWSAAATSYDITTTQGYQYYQMKTSYNAAFGELYNAPSSGVSIPRYLQFGLKLYF